MSKPEIEFTPTEDIPWSVCAGNVPTLAERVLATDPESGVATRMLRFEPNTDATANGVQVHDFWEEVYIVEGSFTDVTLGKKFVAGDFACRPPGMAHGPWITGDDGCLTYEVRYRSA